jgi:enterochelin esterase-like enzyme
MDHGRAVHLLIGAHTGRKGPFTMTKHIPHAVTARLATAAALAAALCGCQHRQDTFLAPSSQSPRLEVRTVRSSITPQDSMSDVVVYLPPGYNRSDPDTKYPVVYMLHGYGDDESTFVNALIPQMADDLIRRGEIDPMVIVFPYSGLGGTSFYADNPYLGAYGSYIPAVVMPYIAANYNVDPTLAGISGHSMGGYGAMAIALQYPTAFRSVASHSGPLHFESLNDACILNRIALENSVVDPNTGQRTFQTRIDITKLLNNPPADYLQSHLLTLISTSLALDFNTVAAPSTDTNAWGQFGMDSYRYPYEQIGPDLWLGFWHPVILNGNGTAQASPGFARLLEHDFSTLLARAHDMDTPEYERFKQLAIYLDAGIYDDCDPRDDGVGFDIYPQVRFVHDQLTSYGIAHRYVEYPGAHSNMLYYHIADDLRTHSTAFRAARGQASIAAPHTSATPARRGIYEVLGASRS